MSTRVEAVRQLGVERTLDRLNGSDVLGARYQPMMARGRVSWFNPAKRFGFVKLDGHLGDAFLYFDVLKAGGYYFVPRGTTIEVRVEPDERGAQRVTEVLQVDPSTAREGEPPPLLRKTKAERRDQQEQEVQENETRMRASIAETDRLIGETNKMLRRHREERDTDDAEEERDRS